MNENRDKATYDVDKAFLVEVYKAQWADIHHSRSQDWEIAKLILGGFLGLSGLKAFTNAVLLTTLLAFGFVIVCIFGILVTVRHRQLFDEKMDAIKRLENEMGMDDLQLFPVSRPRRVLRTQNILIATYVLWGVMFALFAVMEGLAAK